MNNIEAITYTSVGNLQELRVLVDKINELVVRLNKREADIRREVQAEKEQYLDEFVVAFRKYLENDTQMARSQGVKSFYEQFKKENK